jgi:energy-coupling factor transporter ATP-binding protein EcfA2
MYARLGFSIAAHVDPEVLIVDEVLSVGDFVFQQRCMDRMRAVIAGGTTLLFVSHNLKSVSEICQRAILLEHGKVAGIGNADDILRQYMNSTSISDDPEDKKAVKITQVRVRDRSGEKSTFESGQTVWVDIEVTAKEALEKLAVVIWMVDQTDYEIFNTSTERLGLPPISLKPGDVYRCTYELTLNIAHGSVGLNVAVYRYDLQKNYDRRMPAATLFVGSSMSVRGAVNCFPKVIESSISEVGAETTARR